MARRRPATARAVAGGAGRGVSSWFGRLRVTRPGAYRLDRILRLATVAHDDAALQLVADRLDAATRARLEAWLVDCAEGPPFALLAADPGRASLESLLAEIGKLEILRAPTLKLSRNHLMV